MVWAVLTGSVLFSTTILGDVATRTIWRATFSQYWRSAARPAPSPKVLVGVLTETKIMSASPNRAVDIGREKQVATARSLNHIEQAGLIDGQVVGLPSRDPRLVHVHDMTLYCGHFMAIMAMVGPPTYPAPMHAMHLVMSVILSKSLPVSAVDECCHVLFELLERGLVDVHHVTGVVVLDLDVRSQVLAQVEV